MKFILTLLLLTLFLDASYIRSIRVTSFLDKSRAEKGLLKLQNFVKNHKNLNKLEAKLHFQYTLHKIDKHYMIVIEPLTDKAAVQEILDTLRIKYKKAYPRKLQTMPIITQKIKKEVKNNLPVIEKAEAVQKAPIIKIKAPAITAKKVKEIEDTQKESTPAILHDNLSKEIDNSDINTSNENISSLLIFILAILLIISFFYIYFSRKKQKKKVHSKTLTEIVIDSDNELKPKTKKSNLAFKNNEQVESLINNNYHLEHKELNTNIGLNSYNNILSTYKNALKEFQDKYANSSISIEKFCDSSDFTQALTIIESVQKESNQIGAFNLDESIKIMKKEIELGEDTQWEKSIWAYGITLKQLFIEIDHYLN